MTAHPDLDKLPKSWLRATFRSIDRNALLHPDSLTTPRETHYVAHRRIVDGARVREWHEEGNPCLTCIIRKKMIGAMFVGYTTEQVDSAFAEEWDP
jgi:hypothetical protein